MNTQLPNEFYNDALVLDRLATVRERNAYWHHKIFSLITKEVEQSHKLTYELLGKLMWMEFSSDNPNVPFGSYSFKNENGDSVVVDINGLSEKELRLCAKLIEGNQVSDARVKARLADVLWVRKWKLGKYNPQQYAETAIDAYRAVPLTTSDWMHGDGRNCWSRALMLARQIKDDGRINQITHTLLSTFNAISNYNDVRVDDIAAILLSEKARLPDSTKKEIACKLENMAEAGMAEGFHSSCDAIEKVIVWYAAAGMETEVDRLSLRRIEWLTAKADELIRSQDNTHGNPFVGAALFYEKAIGFAEKLPKRIAGLSNLKKRLRLKLRASQQKMRPSMHTIEKSMDVSNIKERVSNHISGLPRENVLSKFAELFPVMDPSRPCQVSILDHICTKTYCDSEGRTLRRTDGSNEEIETNTIKARSCNETIKFASEVILYPAYKIIKREHELRMRDFADIVKGVDIIPAKQRNCWVKALWSGWRGRFFEAELLIAPLVESLVRSLLCSRGVKTSHCRKEDNAEQYDALGTLMKQVEKEKDVISPQLCKEIKAFFCDTVGPNVRNVIAHGLFCDDDFNSYIAFYTWFFALRLVVSKSTAQ